MSNKTIYFGDDELWTRAKTLAGKKGLSAVLQEAVREFVHRAELKDGGFEEMRLDIFDFDEGDDTYKVTDRIAFRGKKLVQFLVRYKVEPHQADPEQGLEAGTFLTEGVEVYLTESGKLVLTIDETDGYA